jgi:hypothetical protein
MSETLPYLKKVTVKIINVIPVFMILVLLPERPATLAHEGDRTAVSTEGRDMLLHPL